MGFELSVDFVLNLNVFLQGIFHSWNPLLSSCRSLSYTFSLSALGPLARGPDSYPESFLPNLPNQYFLLSPSSDLSVTSQSTTFSPPTQELALTRYILCPASPNDKTALSPFQPQMGSTTRKDPWSWEASTDAEFIKTAECLMCCSELKYKYLELYHGAFVVVKVAVVWCWKYCYHCWKLFCSSPMVHLEPVRLSFMGSNYWKQSVLL